MSGALSLELATESIDRVLAELAIAFCFEDDRPLRGPAGRADWRLCGDLSRFVVGSSLGSRFAVGSPAAAPAGQALLLPTEGRLRAGRFLLLGLGPSRSFDPDACARAVQDATRRALDLRARTLAMGPPGAWLDRIPVGIGAQACVRGAVAALEGTSASLEVRLVTTRERLGRVLRGLEAAASDMEDRGVAIQLPRRPRNPAAPAPPARGGRTGSHPQP